MVVDVSGIFYFFSLGEGEEGVPGAGEGGGGVFIEYPRGGGRGAGRVSAAN